MAKIFVSEQIIPIDSQVRIRLKLFREKGRGLINFVRQLEMIHEDKWKVVVRYDCFHGFLHKDIYSVSGRKSKVERISSFVNLKEALMIAQKDLTENYESYIRKFVGDKR